MGYHTWPQVIVGGLLGTSTAAGWFFGGTQWAVTELRAWPPGIPLLYAATLVGMVLFVLRNVLAWHKERRERGERKLRTSDDASGGGFVPAPAT